MSSLPELLRSAADRLAAAGVPSPRHDAEALAGYVLGVPRGALPRREELSNAQAAAFDGLIARRARREPLQHLTGRAAFRYLELAVGPGVFLPRPETEVVVDWSLSRLRPGATAIDLGAGSGAIALALATEAPGTAVYAVEKDAAAYSWLQRNTAGRPVTCLQLDFADLPTAAPDLLGAVDLVVSNPPYIPFGSRPLDPEVARYDPPIALWGGLDGLDMVRTVAQVAGRLLVAGGSLAIEHADAQGASVPGLLAASGWTDVADHRDLAGRDRFATATWPGQRV